MENSIILRIIVLMICYLIGSISPSYLIGKYIYGIDIRKEGSGNPGTTNAFRTMGKTIGITTLVVDILKGVLASYLGYKIIGPIFSPFAGLLAVIGHNFPFYLDFKGGKGVATSIGVGIIIAPKLLILCLLVSMPILLITKMVSAASISAFIVVFLYAIYLIIINGPMNYIIVLLALSILNIYRHRGNIKRILNGTENKIGRGKK